MSDWLAVGHKKLYDLVTEIVTYIDNHAVMFGMDKDSRSGDWYNFIFKTCFEKYLPLAKSWLDETKRTPYITTELKGIEEELIPLIRDLATMLKGNKLVLDADLMAMHIPPRPTHEPHPSPVADLPPFVEIVPLESNRLKIVYRPEGEGTEHKSGKPKGQHGVEIKWGFFDEAVKKQDDLPNSLFDTDSPYILKFNLDDAGKAVSIALRWENNVGVKGPWGQ
ncbi:MAG: hypothetical protein LBJ58_04600, partial [Tannerellaceae bacterium]|nr:hypothetical protein [Tannerellaceae bacterium]